MTEFSQALRHMCRNPKCRSKLPAPVPNEREAFCARGCYQSFYLRRRPNPHPIKLRKGEIESTC